MKNILFAFVAGTLFFTSCCNDEKSLTSETSKGRVNLLLPASVPVNQLFAFDNISIPSWQKELKANDFISKVFSKVLSSEVTVFEPFADDSIKSTKEDIFSKMGTKSEPFNLSEIKAIYFEEEWSLDTAEPFLFEKNILNWSPVRSYMRDKAEGEIKKLIFKVKAGNPTELLAKNVIYEFYLEDTLNPANTKSINNEVLAHLIVDKALSGKIKVYDPMDVNKLLSVNDIETKMGVRRDTVYVDDINTGKSDEKIINTEIDYSEIRSIVFIEDWYYDSKTFAIKKVITGICPVRYYQKPGSENESDMVKSVAFMMYLGKEKTKLFN